MKKYFLKSAIFFSSVYVYPTKILIYRYLRVAVSVSHTTPAAPEISFDEIVPLGMHVVERAADKDTDGLPGCGHGSKKCCFLG